MYKKANSRAKSISEREGINYLEDCFNRDTTLQM
jgi:hypothetical protein